MRTNELQRVGGPLRMASQTGL